MHAVIFDVDGVLVASPHEPAWRAALAGLMAGEWRAFAPTAADPSGRFTTAVYQEHVAGKARVDGAAALLEYFGMPRSAQFATTLAARKQDLLDVLIRRGEFQAFEDGLRLVRALRLRGVRLGVASSSKNADRFMRGVPLDSGETLRDAFDANVCGRDLPRGKPHPDIFLLAAQELRVAPERCVVVEDATSGIRAAAAAGMRGLGVARLDDAMLLETAGAELVVTNLDQVGVDALVRGHLERAPEQSALGVAASYPC
ncbi:MAG: HAD family hydrolase [Chloroflexota bacterium]